MDETPQNTTMSEYVAFSLKVSKEEPNKALIEDFKKNPRWRENVPIHVSTLVSSFSGAVMMADNWEHDAYTLPLHFEGVLNWISFMVKKAHHGSSVVRCTVADAADSVISYASDHPDFAKWQIKKAALRCNLIECLWNATKQD
jgi:hypothetical protein